MFDLITPSKITCMECNSNQVSFWEDDDEKGLTKLRCNKCHAITITSQERFDECMLQFIFGTNKGSKNRWKNKP